MPHFAASDLDLHCSPMSRKKDAWHMWVNNEISTVGIGKSVHIQLKNYSMSFIGEVKYSSSDFFIKTFSLIPGSIVCLYKIEHVL